MSLAPADPARSSRSVAAALELQAWLAGQKPFLILQLGPPGKDPADRAAIMEALDRQLKKGDKALAGNSAYRRYLGKTARAGAFEKRRRQDRRGSQI